MIRQALIALGAISLVLGSQGIGLALNCPPHPEQTGKDWEGEVNAAVAKIGPVSGGEAKTKLKAVTQDLLGKLPDAGKIYLEQMKYATICSSIRDDKTLSESEKRKQMMEYDLEIQKAKERHSSGTKPQSKQSGKTKADGPQSIVSPPVPSITRADTKQPEMPKSHSAASQNPSISQQSAGANSPNIIGDKNSVIIMPPADKPSGQEPSDIQDEKLYIECEGKQIPQTTLSDRKVKGLAFSHITPGSSATTTEFQSIGMAGGRTDWVVDGRAFECQITNYGTVPVLKVQITFELHFKETVWLDSKGAFTHRHKFSEHWDSQIRKLDPWPAERFTFIMKNVTNDWLEVKVPEFVELQILGESKKRRVPLSRPDDDPGHLGTYYRSVFLFPPADFAQQNRPENWPQGDANSVAK